MHTTAKCSLQGVAVFLPLVDSYNDTVLTSNVGMLRIAYILDFVLITEFANWHSLSLSLSLCIHMHRQLIRMTTLFLPVGKNVHYECLKAKCRGRYMEPSEKFKILRNEELLDC